MDLWDINNQSINQSTTVSHRHANNINLTSKSYLLTTELIIDYLKNQIMRKFIVEILIVFTLAINLVVVVNSFTVAPSVITISVVLLDNFTQTTIIFYHLFRRMMQLQSCYRHWIERRHCCTLHHRRRQQTMMIIITHKNKLLLRIKSRTTKWIIFYHVLHQDFHSLF